MKRFVCAFLCTMLLLGCFSSACAKIVPVFDEAFYEDNDLRKDDYVGTRGGFVCNAGTLYISLTNSMIYTWSPADQKYAKFCDLPQFPQYDPELDMNKQGEAMQTQIKNAVFSLIPSGEELYGFNPLSGRIGIIQKSGITWSNTHLDTSIMTDTGTSYPSTMLYPFIDHDKLYAFYDLTWLKYGEFPCEGTLFTFDLKTGAFQQADLHGAFTFCRYGSDSLLLLRSNGSTTPVLSSYSLQSGAMEDLTLPLPIKLKRSAFNSFTDFMQTIGGLAYNETNQQIIFVYQDKLWSSTAGKPFEVLADLATELPSYFSNGFPFLDYNALSWFLPDGSYALQTSGAVFIYSK